MKKSQKVLVHDGKNARAAKVQSRFSIGKKVSLNGRQLKIVVIKRFGAILHYGISYEVGEHQPVNVCDWMPCALLDSLVPEDSFEIEMIAYDSGDSSVGIPSGTYDVRVSIAPYKTQSDDDRQLLVDGLKEVIAEFLECSTVMDAEKFREMEREEAEAEKRMHE